MRRTMNIWLLVALCACVLIGFVWYNQSLNKTLKELDTVSNDAKIRLTQLQGEQSELEAQVASVGTDAFVDNQARTLYGYIMPDEVRFVIDNPEALYGDEPIPSP